MADKQQRLPRFTRDPDAAGSFQFTKRDLEILRHVAEHRFIKSEWLVKLVGGSKQQVLRRLHLLYHHGYLDRPREQLDYYHEGGSRSMVYGLASRGAGRLRRDLNMPFERMDWTTRSKRVGRLFLEHTLMVSEFMAQLEIRCREEGKARLIPFHEACDSKTQQPRWKISIPGRTQTGVVPDKVFALDNTMDDGTTKRQFYFLEADAGTMPVSRSSNRGSCIEKKLRAYQATYQTRAARKLIGGAPFIVSFLVTSPERSRHITEVIWRLKLKRQIFRVYFSKHGQPPNRCDEFVERVMVPLQ